MLDLNTLISRSIIIITPIMIMTNTANAATTTNTFQSQIIIQASCTILSTNTLDFGTQGLLNANVDSSATFDVQCTNTTPYDVRMDAGSTVGGSVATRRMIGGGTATVDYTMFRDAGRTLNWGETDGVDTLGGTGSGASQTLTVYGRVPIQTTPAPDTYTDTVTVTVSY